MLLSPPVLQPSTWMGGVTMEIWTRCHKEVCQHQCNLKFCHNLNNSQEEISLKCLQLEISQRLVLRAMWMEIDSIHTNSKLSSKLLRELESQLVRKSQLNNKLNQDIMPTEPSTSSQPKPKPHKSKWKLKPQSNITMMMNSDNSWSKRWNNKWLSLTRCNKRT